jgi:putative transposase
MLALRAFLRLESYCFHTGISWFAAKTQIIREAVRACIARPQYHLIRTA